MENNSVDNKLCDTPNISDKPTIEPADKVNNEWTDNYETAVQGNRQCQGVHGCHGEEVLYVAKLTEHAIMPTRGTPKSAGLDLYAAYDCVIPVKGVHPSIYYPHLTRITGQYLCKTDIQIAVPTGTYGRVAPRSGECVFVIILFLNRFGGETFD